MNPLDPHAFTLENAVDPKTTDTVAVERPPNGPSLGDLMKAQQEKLRKDTDALLATLRDRNDDVRPCRCRSCMADTMKGGPYRGAAGLEVAGHCPASVESSARRTRWQRLLCWLGFHRSLGMGATTVRNERTWAWDHCACGATRLVILHHSAGSSVQRHPWNFPAKTT